ncbi:MAG: D-aminoacyl-tRNA deacylase [Candidatus Caldarchaeum sp.]|nr:D-aminoacyl-tRNA deacylase [Candidatus Caldarchaeum sp.]MDW8360633.1 D-aminoacyl-tRNA deacylase [Candidatus Caldarchaeum sp.]
MASAEDVAAMNVMSRLRESFGFKEGPEAGVYVGQSVEARVLHTSALYAEKTVETLEADLILVASKHVSESGRRCLLVHSTGNWTPDAKFGGLPSKLSMTSAKAVYTAVHVLISSVEDLKLKDVEVGLEATHHGPFSQKPLLFVEVGSSLDSWTDIQMAEAAAEACVNICKNVETMQAEFAAGFGGGHYARDFFRAVVDGRYAVGHIASKHVFPLDEDLVRQAFTRTAERPRIGLVDWDGLRSEHRQNLLKTLEDIDVEVVKV